MKQSHSQENLLTVLEISVMKIVFQKVNALNKMEIFKKIPATFVFLLKVSLVNKIVISKNAFPQANANKIKFGIHNLSPAFVKKIHISMKDNVENAHQEHS